MRIPLGHQRSLAVLILAAGGSRRLGRPKQFVQLMGATLLAHSVDLAISTGAPWIGVVTGHQASRATCALRGRPVHCIRCAEWGSGLSASLRAGARRLPRNATHVLVLTVDQWRVTPADLQRLCKAMPQRVPVGTMHGEHLGIPAIFPRRFWPALLTLTGDRGAQPLLRATKAQGVYLSRASQDLDTPLALRTVHDERYRYSTVHKIVTLRA